MSWSVALLHHPDKRQSAFVSAAPWEGYWHKSNYYGNSLLGISQSVLIKVDIRSFVIQGGNFLFLRVSREIRLLIICVGG